MTFFQAVEIRDLGSLHGTYINDEQDRIAADSPRQLRNGDQIRFGVSLQRNGESFSPLKVKVGIEFKK